VVKPKKYAEYYYSGYQKFNFHSFNLQQKVHFC